METPILAPLEKRAILSPDLGYSAQKRNEDNEGRIFVQRIGLKNGGER